MNDDDVWIWRALDGTIRREPRRRLMTCQRASCNCANHVNSFDERAFLARIDDYINDRRKERV